MRTETQRLLTIKRESVSKTHFTRSPAALRGNADCFYVNAYSGVNRKQVYKNWHLSFSLSARGAVILQGRDDTRSRLRLAA